MKGAAGRIARVVVKEMQQLRRDPLALRLAVIAPVVQLLLVGYAATLDVRHIPTVVVDLDRSAVSRELVRAAVASGTFDLVGDEERVDAALHWLDDGRAALALVVPVDYAERIAAGDPIALQAVVDGSNSSEATSAIGHLGSIVTTRAIERVLEELPADERYSGAAPPIQAELRVWYNEALRSSHFMVPGVIGMILMVTTMLLTALAVAREKEVGTLEQILVTPVRPSELLLGKLAPYAVLGLLQLALVLAVGRFWFGVPLRGSIALLIALSTVFLMTTLGLGLLAASVSATQQAAMWVCMAFVTPNMLLSGFIFPIENMPVPIQALTTIMPVRYFLAISRGILLKGAGFTILWPQALALAALGFAVLAMSITVFRSHAVR
jgi:ABC-2 type transport system permease protein